MKAALVMHHSHSLRLVAYCDDGGMLAGDAT